MGRLDKKKGKEEKEEELHSLTLGDWKNILKIKRELRSRPLPGSPLVVVVVVFVFYGGRIVPPSLLEHLELRLIRPWTSEESLRR